MSNWKSILKESRQISDVGIKTKLGTRPLTISDNGDDENECCKEAHDAFEEMLSRNFHLKIDYPLEAIRPWYHTVMNIWTKMQEELGFKENRKWTEENCQKLENIMDYAFDEYFEGFGDSLIPQYEYYETTEKIKSIFDEWDNCEE